jgi:medium-chain acyl-[acyl-carrier-protein] hydrolase
MKYRMKTEVDVHDLDFNGVAKASSIMKYIQTAAQCQLTEGGMSYDNLKSNNRAFILSRVKLEVLKPLPAYTPLTAVTYPCESRGYSFLRCYELECDGEVVARAISVWALIDTESRALVRVNDFDLGLPTMPQNELVLRAMKLPSSLTDIGGYGVHYGDVDQNRHMNNTKYPDMYSNFLPLAGKMIRSITINYSNEAKIGEKLRVQRAEENGYYYFRTVRSDGQVNSEAQVELCDI